MSLNFLPVIPIYEIRAFSKHTVALYIMQQERQFPNSGQLDCLMQLYVFVAAFMFFYLVLLCNAT